MATTAYEPRTKVWTLDPARSTAEFAQKTFWGLMTVHGHFDSLEGTYDGRSIDLKIDGASLDTKNTKRDHHLRSEDFFHVEKHPHVRFTSTNVTEFDGGVVRVSGELEARGTRVPLTFEAQKREAGDELELEATTTVDPRALGMSAGQLGMIRGLTTLHVRARLV